MDADEYFKTVVPGSKRSALDPYWDVIQRARSEGYTLKQIMEFLASNGVHVGIAGISAYIKRREGKLEKQSKSRPISNLSDSIKEPPKESNPFHSEIPVVAQVSKPNEENSSTGVDDEAFVKAISATGSVAKKYMPQKPANRFNKSNDGEKK